MRFLCVMDRLEKLDPEWDNSLAVLDELARRGHETWAADVPEIWAAGNSVLASAHRIRRKGKIFTSSRPEIFRLDQFDKILIRKEPPFNKAYLQLTDLLEPVAERVPILNHPAGIRNTNEKLSVLNFPKWIPKTLVSDSAESILDFQKRLRGPVIVKPLDQKGGRGIFLITPHQRDARHRLIKATRNGKKTLMAQQFINAKKKVEKRIVILNGKILALYEKRPRGKEFRANLALGGTWHPARASVPEKKLVRELRPYLLKQGLYFVGIDVLNGKLLEINVTCPAGVTEARFLRQRPDPLAAWADFLEAFPPPSGRRAS